MLQRERERERERGMIRCERCPANMPLFGGCPFKGRVSCPVVGGPIAVKGHAARDMTAGGFRAALARWGLRLCDFRFINLPCTDKVVGPVYRSDGHIHRRATLARAIKELQLS